jgi:hypothetical protein
LPRASIASAEDGGLPEAAGKGGGGGKREVGDEQAGFWRPGTVDGRGVVFAGKEAPAALAQRGA